MVGLRFWASCRARRVWVGEAVQGRWARACLLLVFFYSVLKKCDLTEFLVPSQTMWIFVRNSSRRFFKWPEVGSIVVIRATFLELLNSSGHWQEKSGFSGLLYGGWEQKRSITDFLKSRFESLTTSDHANNVEDVVKSYFSFLMMVKWVRNRFFKLLKRNLFYIIKLKGLVTKWMMQNPIIFYFKNNV